jgi:tRNA-2-methylthio-N6-dimethylallyladenosine synthase
LQRKHTLLQNKKRIGSVEMVLVEKESKRSVKHWAGRTDSNKWVIFEKNNFKIGDLVPIKIIEAKGITLRGETINLNKMEAA